MKENSATGTLLPIHPDRNAVIQAAAGTGKTWLLIGRIVRLLLTGASPESILAITFTRKAAAEMQLRLRQRLLAMAQATDDELDKLLREIGGEDAPEAAKRARQLYEQLLTTPQELRATTFHAFCQELLTRFPLEAGIAPGFELAEQTAEIETAAWRALDQDLSRRRGAIDEAMTCLLVECGGLVNTRRALQEFLAHRSDWWAYTENQSDPVAFADRQLRETLSIDPTHAPLERFAADADFRARLASYLTLLTRGATAKHQASIAALQEALAPSATVAEFYRLLQQAYLRKDGQPRAFTLPKASVQALGADTAQALVQLHDEILARLQTVAEQQFRHKTWARSRAWYVVGHRLLEHYQRLKRERETLDFADLEWLTYRMLNHGRHAEWVQYKLDQRIDHLLIDEFQDTNPTQWQLLLPLLQEMAAGPSERSRSVFLVGDEKQSIYRFRRADSELLALARDWLREHAHAQTHDQYISWRSSPAIIQFVNLVFAESSVSADNPGALEQNLADFPLRGFRAHETHHSDLPGHVEILPLIPRRPGSAAANALNIAPVFRNPLAQPRTLEEDRRHQREGEMIAVKIRSLLDQPIRDKDKIRVLDYGDIVILLRDRTHAAAYEAALRQAHIPYVGAGRGTFLDCLEIRDIVQLLRLLITPFDDVALASVLRSPMFAATDDDLIALADADNEASWFDRLRPYTAETTAPLSRAARLLPKWRDLADRIPVHDLLDRIYYETNLPERYRSAAPPHLRERIAGNLTRLLDLALELDGGRFPSLARFLARLDALTREDNEAQGASGTGNQVRVLTIHAAKGLESPVVFLADSARGVTRERGIRTLIEWPIRETRPTQFLLTGVKSDLDTVSRDALAHQEQAAQREEANLLYVALTRARHMLFVSGCEPGAKTAVQAGDSARGWYGFIERRLLAAHEQGRTDVGDLQVLSIPGAEAVPFNTYGTLKFGSDTPLPIPSRASPTPARLTVDPALTRPFERQTTATAIRPSDAAVTDADDTIGTDSHRATLTEAKRRGIVTHRMLDELTSRQEDRTAIRQRLSNEFSDSAGGAWFTDCWNEACTLVDAPEHRDLFDARLYREARNEIAVLYREDGREIAGVIDRLIIRERDLILVDYKTNRVEARDTAALAIRYTPQLKLYADGLRRLWPQHALTAVLLFTARRQRVVVDIR